MIPPFIANPDAFRCMTCTLWMALRALGADERLDLDAVDRLTARRPREGTWTHAAYLALAAFPTVRAEAWDPFDYERFARDPLLTVLDTFSPPIAANLANGFDLVAAATLARRLLDERPIVLHRRAPSLEDVDRVLDSGALLIANVNAAALDGRSGTTGHSVLLYARDGDLLVAHDPGTDGRGVAGRRIPRDTFVRAWSFLGDGQRELLALRAASDADRPQAAGKDEG
jgi:hypothetical protein